jgi:hypothetical protein
VTPAASTTARPPGPVPAWLANRPRWLLPVAGGTLAALLLFGGWLVVRFVHYTRQDLRMKQRMVAEDAAERLAAHRREIEAQLGQPNAWQRIVAQLITDALRSPVRLRDTAPDLSGTVPYFAVQDAQYRFYFTPAPDHLLRAGVVRQSERIVPLDHPPETRVEVRAVWSYLAAQHLRDQAPALPRQAAWFLVTVRHKEH